MKKFLENNKKKLIIGTSAAALFSVLLGAIYLNSNNKEVKGNKVYTVETKKEDKKETEKPKTEVKKETEKPKTEIKKEDKKEVKKPKTEVKKEVEKPKIEVKKENITKTKKEVIQTKKEVEKPKIEAKKEVIQPKKETEKPKTDKLIPGTWRFEGGFAIYAESENLETYYSMQVGNSGKVFETVEQAKEYGFNNGKYHGFGVDELYYNGKIMYTVDFKLDTLIEKNNDLSLEVKK